VSVETQEKSTGSLTDEERKTLEEMRDYLKQVFNANKTSTGDSYAEVATPAIRAYASVVRTLQNDR
jgi:hypothetical protein